MTCSVDTAGKCARVRTGAARPTGSGRRRAPRAVVGAATAAAVALAATAAHGGAAAPVGFSQRVEHTRSSVVLIPEGPFFMGFPGAAEHEEIRAACVTEFGGDLRELCNGEALTKNSSAGRTVYLPAFEIDRYETSVRDYRRCAASGGCDVVPLLAGDRTFLEDALPMVNVTWRDAADYCAWAGRRLPTEAEWEKAARGTDSRRWPWGNHDRRDGSNHGQVVKDPVTARSSPQFGLDERDGAPYAVPPGAMTWSDSPYGVFDLAGNVSEWVADYYVDSYAGLATIDPVVDSPPNGLRSMRVYRGGSWAEPRLFGRTYFRMFAAPSQRSFDRGFRCARDVRR
jgi:formylglycine-generating enzyme